MTARLVSRAVIAATAGHIAIVDGPIRVDAQFDKAFPAEELCQALRNGFRALAQLTGEDSSPLTAHLAAVGLIENGLTAVKHIPGTMPLARALGLGGDA